MANHHKRYGGYWRFPSLLDYCYLVNPFFPPKRMIDEMHSNFEILLRNYPSGQWVNSLLAAKYFGVKAEYIAVGNGAAELIKSFAETHAADRIGVIYPTFDEYPNRLTGADIVPFISDKKDFRYDADDLMDFYADKNIDLLLLVNPDNPSRNFITIDNVIKLAAWCKDKGIFILVDESFVDFTEGFRNNSLLHNEILESFPNLSVMKSISKSYGVPSAPRRVRKLQPGHNSANEERCGNMEYKFLCRILYADLRQIRSRLPQSLCKIRSRTRSLLLPPPGNSLSACNAIAGKLFPLCRDN